MNDALLTFDLQPIVPFQIKDHDLIIWKILGLYLVVKIDKDCQPEINVVKVENVSNSNQQVYNLHNYENYHKKKQIPEY